MKKLTFFIVLIFISMGLKAQTDTICKQTLKDCKGKKIFLALFDEKGKSINIKIDTSTVLTNLKANDKNLQAKIESILKNNFDVSSCHDPDLSISYHEILENVPILIARRSKLSVNNVTRILQLNENHSLKEILNSDYNYAFFLTENKSSAKPDSHIKILSYKDSSYNFEFANIKDNALVKDSIYTILNFISQNENISEQPDIYIQVNGDVNSIVFNKKSTDTLTVDSKLADKLRGDHIKIYIPGLSGSFYKIKFSESSGIITKKITDTADNSPATKADIKKIISSTLEGIAAEKGYAASVELKGEFITLHPDKNECECSGGVQQYKAGAKLLKIDSVKFVTYNNTIYQIDIVGTVNGKQIQTITNNGWGFRLGALMTGAGSVPVTINGATYYLQYCELFYVRPVKDNVILYNIKDATYRLKPTEKVLLARKDLLDFMSASAFVDLFGLNKTSTNSPITGELYMAFYLNHARRNWVRTLNLTTTITSDAFGSKDNFLETQFINKNQFNYRAIDLLKNINFSFKPLLNIYTFDIKPANMLVEVNTGTQFIGTNVKQVYVTDKAKTDSTVYNNLYSYTGVFQARFKVTEPDSRFGFDLQMNYLTGYNLFNSTFSGLRGDHPLDELTAANYKSGLGNILDIDFNIFIHPQDPKSNTNKGGFYIKSHFGKAMGYQNGFFALLVGYSTDIQNFFK